MFNQTQRAFMTSMGQTDVLEAARTVTDMMTRELEQVTPAGAPGPNYYTRISTALTPLTQSLPSNTSPLPTRTNYLEDIYVLTRQNQNWVGIGYCVRVPDPNGYLYPAITGPGQAGVGSLYRWSETMPVLAPQTGTAPGGRAYPLPGLPTDPGWLLQDFTNACLAANSGGALSLSISNRICDGVVHLVLRAFATNGFPLYNDGVHTNAWFLVRTNGPFYAYGSLHPAISHYTLTYPDQTDLLYTWSNAVPAYLELQLGMMEPRTYSRYDSIAAPAARLAYVQRDDISTRIHLFRQRIPVRDVDPTAFQ